MARATAWLLTGLSLLLALRLGAAAALPRWTTLPAPSPLPVPGQQGTFAADDVKLWYATFGDGPPVLLLHGGLGNADHFGDLVAALSNDHQVLVMDSRGHGRSTRSRHGISYAQMADDVVALLDHLAIPRAAIVGWSDGGVTGLDVAIRYPDRLTKLVVIGTNFDLAGVKPAGKSKTFTEYFARCKREYLRLAPDPKQLTGFRKELRAMWSSQPTYTSQQLERVRAPTLIALGEHDEIIRREHAEKMARLIPHATLQVLPEVSHFALWQDRALVAARVRAFLEPRPTR